MKKILISTSLIVAMLLCIHACTKEEKLEVTKETSQDELFKLADQLESLNASTLAIYPSSIGVQPRRMKFWKRLLCIITADAVGGLVGNFYGGPIGGVALGVASSASMWATTRIEMRQDSQFSIGMNQINYNMNNRISSYDKIGDAHNIIMSKLEQNPSSFINSDGSVDKDRLFNRILVCARELGYNTSNVSINLLRNELVKMSAVYALSEDAGYENHIEKYTTIYPNKMRSINMLKGYIETASNLPNIQAIKAYSVEYEKLVVNSDITEMDKALILSGESIGKNSTVGWTLKPNE